MIVHLVNCCQEVVAGKPYGDLLPVPECMEWEFGGWFIGPDGRENK